MIFFRTEKEGLFVKIFLTLTNLCTHFNCRNKLLLVLENGKLKKL